MSLSRPEQSCINGAKPRGPRTPEGKRISAENAYKHGLAAKKVCVLANESSEAFATFLRALTETYKPCTDTEFAFIMQAAMAQWRLRRVCLLETAPIDLEMDKQAQEAKKTFDTFDKGTRLYLAFDALTKETRTLDMIHR
jgi:hypothetical protein